MRSDVESRDAVLDARAVTKSYWNGRGGRARAARHRPRRRARGVRRRDGPSGSGKTTLLNCLSGLDEIDGGAVLVDGEDIHAMPDARRTAHRARHMGFVFQSFNLIRGFSAQENVELPLLLVGARLAEARDRARARSARIAWTSAPRGGH